MVTRNKEVSSVLVTKTVSESSFSSSLDEWVATANATVSNVYGNIRATVTVLNVGMQKTFSTQPGKTYRIRFKVNLRGWPYMYVKDVAGSTNLISITEFMTPGDYSYTFRALGFQTNIIFHEAGNAAGSVQIASFILEEVDVENAYRFGAGTQEKDDEIFAGAYTAECWEYDSRLGRRWNIDPVVYADQSGYAVFNNCPIAFNDPQGLEGKPTDGGGAHYEKKSKAGAFIRNVLTNIGTFFRNITGGNFGYNSLTEDRWKKVNDNYSGWFGNAVKSTVNFVKRLFGSSSGNHIKTPSGRWEISDWIELTPTQVGNKYFYSMPTSISSEKLWNTRLIVNYTSQSDAGYFSVAGDVGSTSVPMYSSTRIPIDPIGPLTSTATGGPTSLIENNYFYNVFKYGILSSPALKAGAAVMLNGIADVLGGLPNNPVFRKTTAFTVTAHTNSVGYQVHFYVKVKQYVPVRDIDRGLLFRWYHGLQK